MRKCQPWKFSVRLGERLRFGMNWQRPFGSARYRCASVKASQTSRVSTAWFAKGNGGRADMERKVPFPYHVSADLERKWTFLYVSVGERPGGEDETRKGGEVGRAGRQAAFAMAAPPQKRRRRSPRAPSAGALPHGNGTSACVGVRVASAARHRFGGGLSSPDGRRTGHHRQSLLQRMIHTEDQRGEQEPGWFRIRSWVWMSQS